MAPTDTLEAPPGYSARPSTIARADVEPSGWPEEVAPELDALEPEALGWSGAAADLDESSRPSTWLTDPAAFLRRARPWIVGTARGVVEAAALAGADFLLVELTALDWHELAPFQPFAFAALRSAEGWIDDHLDPRTRRRKDRPRG